MRLMTWQALSISPYQELEEDLAAARSVFGAQLTQLLDVAAQFEIASKSRKQFITLQF